jgi:hypothetical protein
MKSPRNPGDPTTRGGVAEGWIRSSDPIRPSKQRSAKPVVGCGCRLTCRAFAGAPLVPASTRSAGLSTRTAGAGPWHGLGPLPHLAPGELRHADWTRPALARASLGGVHASVYVRDRVDDSARNLCRPLILPGWAEAEVKSMARRRIQAPHEDGRGEVILPSPRPPEDGPKEEGPCREGQPSDPRRSLRAASDRAALVPEHRPGGV